MLVLFALAIESMQVLASGRDGSLSDVLIDLFGTYCGLLAAAAIQHHCGQNRTVPARAAMTYQHI
jgi:VanZ family protein